ncbi:Glutarate-semialdehyde dehydrogenase DavD [Trichoderma ghanense]|uniref:Succinate-semialdehyde dehydrogenase, mitochondrial n=1 Tax=Trichoderma ghanense TaxID=65468 RepID=A0ABY2HEF8_9HYPO
MDIAAPSAIRFAPGISSLLVRRASTMAPKLRDPSLLKQNVCYVNGEWVSAKSGKTFKVHDPATGEVIGTAPEFTAADTESAIAAAADAFKSFRTLTGRERSKLLRKWYDLTVENAEDIAQLITWENGKPLADARGEASYAANFFEWFSEEAPRVYGDVIPATVPGNRVWTLKEPVGVCGLITPWNFPAAMITRKIGPALAAGCTVVCKAPGETPFTALALAELAHRAGIPKGVVNIVTTLDNTIAIGEQLTTHPTIKKVSFTGSTTVGKLLMKQSSGTLKKLSLELGGNSPFIVFDDADIDAAVTGAIMSKFRSSGQTCVCANRIYVQEGVYETFVNKFVEKVKSFKVGNGFAEGITHGPLIHDRAISKVDAHVQDAVKKGAKLLVGGQRLPDIGSNFFQLTVLRDMTADMQLASEETFGPVAGLFPFKTEAEVVQLANNSEVGLAGYFYSRDLERVHRVAEALEVGMIGVNTGIISDPAAPFGGVKESGFGREGSKYGIAEYQITKMITRHLFSLSPPTTASLTTLTHKPSLSSSSPSSAARPFNTSAVLLKKRKIAPASNSPSPSPSSSASSSPASKPDKGNNDKSSQQPNPEDPLDFSSLLAAYATIDAHFKTQLQAVLHGGRFNPDVLGALPVAIKPPHDGKGHGHDHHDHHHANKAPAPPPTNTFPLRELAQIVPRSGRIISLLVNEREYIKPIMSAVQASKDFNQQPQRSEDNELELLLKVEMERKEDLVRRVKEACQGWRERVRQARTKHEKALKEWKKNGVVLPDVVRKADKELQKVQDKKMKEIDGEEAQVIKQLDRR